MSAVLKDVSPPERPGNSVARVFAEMTEGDLVDVVAIEQGVYTHPWTRGNFADSLRAGYQCHTLRVDGRLLGYFILIVAAGEAHLLNLSVAGAAHRRGHGSALLREVMRRAGLHACRSLFLEVRPSNLEAQALYARFGFRRIAVRRGYYPTHGGREDALVFTLNL
jgi:ribosomal-protein-alanine N-acetyltransferase